MSNTHVRLVYKDFFTLARERIFEIPIDNVFVADTSFEVFVETNLQTLFLLFLRVHKWIASK